MSARIRSALAIGLLLAVPLGIQTAFAQAVAPAQSPAPAATPSGDQLVDEATRALKELEESHTDGVAAKVNDSPISNYDVRQRVALFVSTSGTRPTAEQLKSIRDQVLKQLETERLELLEAQKAKVTVSASDVDKQIGEIISDNHMSQEQLNKILSSAGVRVETLRAQIAAQIVWSKLVQDQLGDRVHVSQLDVDDEIARLKRGANKPHYLVAEIFQAVDTPEQEEKVKKDMDNLETQLQAGAPFSAVARQFSQNPTAAQGGDLGVVQEGQLPPELDKVLVKMRPGEKTQPIRATGGYYILFLRELQMPVGMGDPDPTSQATGPLDKLPLMRILLPMPPKPTNEMMERAREAAEVMRSNIRNCQMVPAVVSKLPGSKMFDLGTMELSELDPRMRDAILKAEPGGSTEPLGSEAGVEIIVRCDKPVPKIGHFQLPTRDQVEEQIYEEQITTLARQYLRDLKRDADIETTGTGKS